MSDKSICEICGKQGKTEVAEVCGITINVCEGVL